LRIKHAAKEANKLVICHIVGGIQWVQKEYIMNEVSLHSVLCTALKNQQFISPKTLCNMGQRVYLAVTAYTWNSYSMEHIILELQKMCKLT